MTSFLDLARFAFDFDFDADQLAMREAAEQFARERVRPVEDQRIADFQA